MFHTTPVFTPHPALAHAPEPIGWKVEWVYEDESGNESLRCRGFSHYEDAEEFWQCLVEQDIETFGVRKA